MISHNDVEARVAAVVRGILVQNGRNGDIAAETRLADAGLTSMDMVNLMLGVEAAFDVTIAQADITPENFQSIRTIERMIDRTLRQPQAA